MSSAAGEVRPALRRGWLTPLVIVLSLTLNVFFIGGLIWSRIAFEHDMAGAPGQRFERIVRDLDLAPPQRDAFQHFVRVLRAQNSLLHEQNEPLLASVWTELGKPTPDQAMIGRLVDQADAHRRTYQRDTATALGEFLASLPADKRAAFVALAMRRHEPGSERLWHMMMP